MATFLATEAMHPALRARVERAVSTRARARHNAGKVGLAGPFAAGGPRFHWTRAFPFVVAFVLIALGYASYRAERRAVAAERASLGDALAAQRARLPSGHESFLADTDRWIHEAARDADRADLVAPSLTGALDAQLRSPAVYVRVPASEARDAHSLADAVRASGKDAFLLCLLRPPASGSERDLLAKVRGVYFGGTKVDEETANVRRLADAHAGLSAVGPTFESALHGADGLPDLRKLRKDLDAAPVAEAARAAAADLLILVLDEPASSIARVELVDLRQRTVLLRLDRRLEDPGTSAAAAVHREPLQGCALARAVRGAAGG